jgi:hypothetical protein
MVRLPPFFYLPNTTTLLAHTAIALLKGTSQELLDEAVQTLANRRLAGDAVMPHLEQNVHLAEVLEKLARDWEPETTRVFANALQMDPAKLDVMDLIVAIAILNEADLESELRGENVSDATAGDLLQNRRITWQWPPPGTPLTPPYVILVAVEQIDTSPADAEVQAILGELVDYKGYKVPQRATGGRRVPLGPLRLSAETIAAIGPRFGMAVQPAAPAEPAAPAAAAPPITGLPGFGGLPFAGGGGPFSGGVFGGALAAALNPNLFPAAAAPAATAPAAAPPAAGAGAGASAADLFGKSSRLGLLGGAFSGFGR